MKNTEKNQLKELLDTLYGLLRNIGSSQFSISQEIEESLRDITSTPQECQLIDSIVNIIKKTNKQILNMQWMNNHLKILHDFGQIYAKTFNEELIYEKVLEVVSRVMPTDAFFIALYQGDSEIQVPFSVDAGKRIPPFTVSYGDGNILSRVIKSQETIHIKTAKELIEPHEFLGSQKTNTCIFVPLFNENQVKAVISAQSFHEFAYRKEHEELLRIIGYQVVQAIETARLYNKIFHMSHTDELTGLKNHRAFHKDLHFLIEEQNERIALMMIDSDELKKTNDKFGHHIGDLYLQRLANGIKSILKEGEEGYRYAGDEFMIIIRNYSEERINDIFAHLSTYLSLHPIVVQSENIVVSFSAGIAIYPEHASTPQALKEAADKALYKSKNMGRKQCMIYSSDLE